MDLSIFFKLWEGKKGNKKLDDITSKEASKYLVMYGQNNSSADNRNQLRLIKRVRSA